MGLEYSKQKSSEDDFDIYSIDEDSWKIVYEKLQKSPVFSKKLHSNKGKMTLFAKQISNVEELKRTYLNINWTDTIKLVEEQINEEDNIDETDVRKETFTDKMNPIGKSKSGEEEFDNSKLKEDFKKNIEEMTEYMKSDESDILKQEVKVKLVISEIVTTPPKRAMRRAISPVLDTLNVMPELGLFHSGLVIGPWKIDWNDSSIVVPKKIIAGAAVMTADIDAISSLSQLEDCVDKIAHVIVKWNLSKIYKDSGGDKKHYGNCQDFNDDLLKALGIKLKFSGPLLKYMETLRKEGRCDMKFIMDQQFREDFGVGEKQIVFKTHEELDKFVNYLISKDAEFMSTHRSEWVLLKSFDRALWLKHSKYPELKEYIPLENEKFELSCPFGDPAINSFLGLQ